MSKKKGGDRSKTIKKRISLDQKVKVWFMPKIGDVFYGVEGEGCRLGETMFLTSTRNFCAKTIKEVLKHIKTSLKNKDEDSESFEDNSFIIWKMERVK